MIDPRRCNVVRSSPFVFAAFAALAILSGCSSADPSPIGTDVQADTPEIVRGVPDHGDYPAVIAIDIAEQALCSGALVAPNVVLTARHCVSRTTESVQCPPPSGTKQVTSNRAASTLKIYAGDSVATAKHVATGKSLVVPDSSELCDDDIALIVLDRDVEGIDPMDIRAQGIAKGDHVVAVGFGKSGDEGTAGVKLVRDHVKVADESKFEFLVGESTCQGDSGGPAIDEDDGASSASSRAAVLRARAPALTTSTRGRTRTARSSRTRSPAPRAAAAARRKAGRSRRAISAPRARRARTAPPGSA